MLIVKSTRKADIDQAQREYWWRKTPHERLAAAARLMAEARQVYAANPANATPPAHGERILKSATPIPRSQR